MQAAFCSGLLHRLFVLEERVFFIRQPAHVFDLRGVIFRRRFLHGPGAWVVRIDRLAVHDALVDEIVRCCVGRDAQRYEDRRECAHGFGPFFWSRGA